jgi:DNA modification methylase
MNPTILRADARSLPLADESVDCIVTSPPYWGLRDYKVPGQIGLERTPEEYVAQIVACFRECWRVLKPMGTAWLNLGDSYAANFPGGKGRRSSVPGQRWGQDARIDEEKKPPRIVPQYLKPKDLVGIPWRVAFALQADGWWLRRDIIWAKPNPMPESVTDRCTSSHEYVFHLAKAERYYYEADAIREAYNESSLSRYSYEFGHGPAAAAAKSPAVGNGDGHSCQPNPKGRNARSVWTIATQPYPGAHFATFPEELARRCILAGCPPGGTVLDPFAGSGTVGRVATELNRASILVDIGYQDQAEKRTREVQRRLV